MMIVRMYKGFDLKLSGGYFIFWYVIYVVRLISKWCIFVMWFLL